MTTPTRNLLVIGHRGAAAYAPENTMVSFAKAVDLRCECVEFDVQLSRDGIPVVFHDHFLKRMTGMLADVDRVDFSMMPPLRTGERIPSLKEVIDFLDGKKIKAYIEIKNPKAIESSLDILKGREGSFVISSFHQDAIQKSKIIHPSMRTMMLFERAPKHTQLLVDDLGADEIGVSFGWWKARLDKKVKWKQPCYTFTVNSPNAAKQALGYGFSGIYSDRPDLLSKTKDTP